MDLLADFILVIHFLYVLFAVLGTLLIIIGGFLKWVWIRNLKLRVVHLISVIIVAIEAIIGVTCPLTEWEYKLRISADQLIEDDITFIGRILRKLIFYNFPAHFFTILYIVFALLVVFIFIKFPPKHSLKN